MQIFMQAMRKLFKSYGLLFKGASVALGLAVILSTTVTTTGCNWCGFKSAKEKGTWQEFDGIFSVMQPADIALYRELLPEELDMPEEPQVGIFIVDYKVVVPCPMKPYKEGAIGIKGVYDGEEAWHTITMPLDLNAARLGGLGVGFPKYMADVTLEEIGENEHGSIYDGVVTDDGVVRLSATFTPGLTRELEPWEEEVLASPLTRLEGVGYQKGPISAKGDPNDYGSNLYRIVLNDKIPGTWDSQIGMVQVHVSPDDPWAGLINTDEEHVALFQVFSGGKDMVVEKVTPGE